MLAASHVVKEHHLDVLWALNSLAVSAVARGGRCRVHIDQLSVALVAEHESLLGDGVSSEVGRVIDVAHLRLPAVEGEVRGLGHNNLLLLEDVMEVLRLHAVGQVDITANLNASLVLTPDEEDGRHAPIPQVGLALGQFLQEDVALDGAALVGESLDCSAGFVLLGLLVGLFLLLKLLTSEDFSLSVVADFDELSGELLVLQVKEVLLFHLVVQILLISVVVLESGVDSVPVQVVVHLVLNYFKLQSVTDQ